MEIQNVTTESFSFSGRRRLATSGSLVIDDLAFFEDSALRTQIRSLLDSGKISVTTPPAGWAVIKGILQEISDNEAAVVTEATMSYLGKEDDIDCSIMAQLNPPEGARFALVQAMGGDIRWSGDSGDPPTTVSGAILYDKNEFVYPADLTEFRMVGTTGSETANAIYFA